MTSESVTVRLRPFTADLTPSVRAVFVMAADGLDPQAVQLLIHIFLSSRRYRGAPGGWLPIPAEWLRRHFRRVDLEVLVRRGVLEADRYFIPGERSRRYRLAPAFAERLARAAAEDFNRRRAPLDPTTGQRLRVRRTLLRDENKNPWPTLVLAGLRPLARCVYARESFEGYLAAQTEVVSALADADEQARAFARLSATTTAYAAVLRQRPVEEAPGQWAYPPSYTVQLSGRLTERGGGFQSCAREARAAAFAPLGARDYDLEASQPSITASMMEDLGLPTHWLRRWADDRAWRDVLADETGLDLRGLKESVIAVLFAAPVPTLKQAIHPRLQTRLVRALRKAATTDVPGYGPTVHDDRLEDVHQRTLAVLSPLVTELTPWFDHLREQYLRDDAPGVEVRGGAPFVRNRAGMRLYPSRGSAQGRLSRLIGHVLQGAEAALIHRLTIAGPDHGYDVLVNLHDGFIALGDVPAEAFARALEATGLHDVRLITKPFPLS